MLLHANAYHVPLVLHEITQKHSRDVQQQDGAAGNDYISVFPVRNEVVQHSVCNDRIRHANKRYEQRREHVENKHFLVRFVVFDESFEQIWMAFHTKWSFIRFTGAIIMRFFGAVNIGVACSGSVFADTLFLLRRCNGGQTRV